MALVCALGLALVAAPVEAFQAQELSEAAKKELRQSWATIMAKKKGQYGPNTCVCKDGRSAPVLSKSGQIRNICGNPNTVYCAAHMAPWGLKLRDHGVYIGNIFARDLYDWDKIPDHHNMVRGYILEDFFVDTNPSHKIAELRSYGGLSGSEYELPAMPKFYERYLALPSFNDFRHFLLIYELQRRNFTSGETGKIHDARAMATRIQGRDPKFKPLRDATHNKISASLIPRLAAYRNQQPNASIKKQVDALIREIEKLTTLDESALKPQLAQIEDKVLRARMTGLMPAKDLDAVEDIVALATLMVEARQTVAAREIAPADARRLIDINVTAAAVIQSHGSKLLDEGGPETVEDNVRLLWALTNASYGAGLLSERERAAATATLKQLLDAPSLPEAEFARKLKQAERTVEWAQNSALLAFSEVWAAWVFLIPKVSHIGDDILRGSPLLIYGQVATKLDNHVAGKNPIRHEVFGSEFRTDVRALNPGLAMGALRVAPKEGGYTRENVIALPETPADLQPASGILTQGEGNVVSHVQLLARSLGIPNIVMGPEAFEKVKPHDGKKVFYIVTPGGRVYIKDTAAMTAQDKTIFEEFNRNADRTSDGALGGQSAKLDIQHERLDLKANMPVPLTKARRVDSGVRSGPKAAFLGELKFMFPENVARGVVVPFGAYNEHYQKATVVLPDNLKTSGIAKAGTPLPEFAKATYDTFFGKMIAAGTSEKELAAWIQPRLAVMRHSIQQRPIAPDLKTAIRDELDGQGLLLKDDKTRTVGVFVRSDTNVEDLDNFNGAGLNLTLFNLKSLDDVYAGIKQVWASPFTYRSFSWRQTLIDAPEWVMPSIVILESVPSEKSGVLVTADIDHGNPDKMLVATSEGVGGAVDGTPAETLLWSADGVELLTLFKSPQRRLLQPEGGSKIVPSTGKEHVLDETEIEALIAAAKTINAKLEPARDPSGKPRPWDIEFGFAEGKLWLFQVRPFVGNDQLKNVPALASLDPPKSPETRVISLEEAVQ